jgi:hypothetical protein
MDDVLVGRLAAAGAVVATVVAPLHALARFQTESGRSDLESGVVRAWAEPADDALAPLLEWASADTIYLTYGKTFVFVLLAMALCAVAVRRRRAPVGLERWGWRIALPGYALAVASAFGEYWTPYLDQSFVLLTLPGMLLSLVGSAVLGTALLRRGFAPRATALLLVGWLPLLVVLSSSVGLGAGVLPLFWAWGVAGHRLASSAQPGAVVPVATR